MQVVHEFKLFTWQFIQRYYNCTNKLPTSSLQVSIKYNFLVIIEGWTFERTYCELNVSVFKINVNLLYNGVLI